jgi:hypothetical protein
MKARYVSLSIVLILINYLIFATLFTRLLNSDYKADLATRTPVPTFTPAPAEAFVLIPTPIPTVPEPTPTATSVILGTNGEENSPVQADTDQAELVAPGSVNIRSGPGLSYSVIGSLAANTPLPIIGRNADTSWWQIRMTNNELGWVSYSVTSAANTDQVPVVEAPAPPPPPVPAQPAASSASPPAPEKPKYQYEPTGWYDDGNAGLTRFMGDIKDTNGNPVNGVFVQASCGTYSTISFPSGPVGWGPQKMGSDWPPGFYDLVVDDRPVPCIWVLTVVDTDDRKTVKATLSESIPVEVTMEKSIIVANWRKNW